MCSKRKTCTNCGVECIYQQAGPGADTPCGDWVAANPAPAPCSGCGWEHDEIHNPTDTCATCNGGSRYHPPTPAAAPLPSYTFDSHTHALKFIAASLTDLGGEQEALDTVCAHISDLTRRLAEAEAELAARTRLASNAQDALRHARAEILSRFTHMEFADRQADANIWVYDLEALCSGLEYQLIRAAAAEARVRELEATIDAMAEAHAHDDMALTAAYLSGAHEGKKQAEAERDALREALTEIVCISDYEMYDECAHSIPLEDCHKLAQAALAATEVKP